MYVLRKIWFNLGDVPHSTFQRLKSQYMDKWLFQCFLKFSLFLINATKAVSQQKFAVLFPHKEEQYWYLMMLYLPQDI